MACDHLNATTEVVIEEYLAALAQRLPGPRRARIAVLTEIRDGLAEAATRHADRGLPAASAVTAAADEFGSPAEVATAFTGELATAQARRTIWGFLVTGPLVGIWWLLLSAPQPWRLHPAELTAAIPILPLVAVGVLVGIGTLATTGRFTRWLPAADPALALANTGRLALICAVGDLALLTIFAVHVATAATSPPAALATIAVGASITRLAISNHALHRCRATRQVLSR